MPIFEKSSEKAVTRAILSEFSKDMERFADTEVLIVGGGPSGLLAARDLALKGVNVLILEKNNYLGGGFWVGGFFMNTITIRAPAHKVLDEIGIKYREFEKGLYVTPGPYACGKLIAAACEAGAGVLNMTMFDDVVLRENNRVAGAVINWSPVTFLPKAINCVDPIAIESKVVIDATGHDASVVRKLEDRGLIKTPGFGAMWIEKSEDAVVEQTGIAHPGLVVIGMAVSTTFGLPRMGPTFGSMLLSGRKGAEVALEMLKSE
ncbi:MAG: sulfide-dependent adenosine diphosphate thiazole synthase [Candidatus Thermoplasmatota archaeon]|nr:sulfide-dependent adenosine diphosphate thiazole synthase [Candidatus Thermoplasmatota archaeon]